MGSPWINNSNKAAITRMNNRPVAIRGGDWGSRKGVKRGMATVSLIDQPGEHYLAKSILIAQVC
ncbi:hypothetical protein D3C72_1991940 [compost metagenome]